ncbi:MAG TPA: hypothetical protein VEY50_12570 [Lysobacter sp.]|nr:hypothetical protein [Lysobacter sp.]
MDGNSPAQFSYAELERRIRAMPEGPAAEYAPSALVTPFAMVGAAGLLLGLLPSLLIEFIAPREWMVWVPRAGGVLALVGFGPGMVRGLRLIVRGLRRWRPEMIEQLDYDFAQFRALIGELAELPERELRERHAFLQTAQQRLTAKQGFLVGSVEKIGILPVLLSVFLYLRNTDDLTAMPFWQAALASGLLILWLLATTVSLMRLRMQLFELVLDEAIRQQAARAPVR